MLEEITTLKGYLESVLKVDRAQRVAAKQGMKAFKKLMSFSGERQTLMYQFYNSRKDEIVEENLPRLKWILTQLAEHNCEASLQIILGVLKNHCPKYRMAALEALSTMSVPGAQKAIRKRGSFWSPETKDVKKLAKELLEQAKLQPGSLTGSQQTHQPLKGERIAVSSSDREQLEQIQKMLEASKAMIEAGFSSDFISNTSPDAKIRWLEEQKMKKEHT